MTPSTGKRAKRNRAVYRHSGIVDTHEIDPEIVAECVPHWKLGAARANSRYGGPKPGGNNKGRNASLYSADDVLKEYGITFDRDPKLWAAYERRIRIAAQS